MFLSLSLEMLFKAGELDENLNRVSISGEQETVEYSESAREETKEVGKKPVERGVTEAKKKGYHWDNTGCLGISVYSSFSWAVQSWYSQLLVEGGVNSPGDI